MKGNVYVFCRLRTEILELCFKKCMPKYSYIMWLKRPSWKKNPFSWQKLQFCRKLFHEKIVQPKIPSQPQKTFENWFLLSKFCHQSFSSPLRAKKNQIHPSNQWCRTQSSGQEHIPYPLTSFPSINRRKLWLSLGRLSGIHSPSSSFEAYINHQAFWLILVEW